MTTRQSRRSVALATRRKSRRTERLPKVQDAVEIWWSVDKTFYRGTLTRRHGEDNFRVVYDDGEMEDLDLTKEFWRFADGPTTNRGSASRDNQDVVEVVLDGSDSPATEAPKSTKKPPRKSERKQHDEKGPEKRISKQKKPVTGHKPSVAETTPPQQTTNDASAAAQNPHNPASAKPSVETSAAASHVPDKVAPAPGPDKKPPPATPPRTRAKPKTLKVKPIEKLSTRAKSQIAKPSPSPSTEGPASSTSYPSTRGNTNAKKMVPAASEEATRAEGVAKASSSNDKPAAESKVRDSVLSPASADPEGTKLGTAPVNPAHNRLNKGSSVEDAVKMCLTKAIGKPKKAVQPPRAKSTRAKVTKGKTADLPQDVHLPPVKDPDHVTKPVANAQTEAVTPSHQPPAASAPALHVSENTNTGASHHPPMHSQVRLAEKNIEKNPGPVAPLERSAPSFAADRKRKRKIRAPSLPTVSNPLNPPETMDERKAPGIKQAGNLSAENDALNKPSGTEMIKEASQPDIKDSNKGTVDPSVVDQDPRGKSSKNAQGTNLVRLLSQNSADSRPQGESETDKTQKRSRRDQEPSMTQPTVDDASAETAAKRLRPSASHPQNVTPQMTSDLQFASQISSEEFVNMVTKAISPSQAMMENLRTEVQQVFSAVSKMKDEKISAEQAFQKTASDSVNQLRASFHEVKTEILEAIEKKAKEAEGRLTATMERLFSEMVHKIVTNSPGSRGRNNLETAQERATLVTRDGEEERRRVYQPSVPQPVGHHSSQNNGERAAQALAALAMNGRREFPSTVADISQVGVNQRNNMPPLDVSKEEEDTARHAILRERVTHLAARQVTVWLLETPHEYETSSGPVSSWAKKVATLIFKRVSEQLMRFESYIQAFQTLCSSLGNDAVELQWFTNPGVQSYLDRARRNYAAWDPPPTDEEWSCELWLLKELSERFSNALKKCDYSSVPDIQACVVVANTAAVEDVSLGPRFEPYRVTNGIEAGATQGSRRFP